MYKIRKQSLNTLSNKELRQHIQSITQGNQTLRDALCRLLASEHVNSSDECGIQSLPDTMQDIDREQAWLTKNGLSKSDVHKIESRYKTDQEFAEEVTPLIPNAYQQAVAAMTIIIEFIQSLESQLRNKNLEIRKAKKAGVDQEVIDDIIASSETIKQKLQKEKDSLDAARTAVFEILYSDIPAYANSNSADFKDAVIQTCLSITANRRQVADMRRTLKLGNETTEINNTILAALSCTLLNNLQSDSADLLESIKRESQALQELRTKLVTEQLQLDALKQARPSVLSLTQRNLRSSIGKQIEVAAAKIAVTKEAINISERIVSDLRAKEAALSSELEQLSISKRKAVKVERVVLVSVPKGRKNLSSTTLKQHQYLDEYNVPVDSLSPLSRTLAAVDNKSGFLFLTEEEYDKVETAQQDLSDEPELLAADVNSIENLSDIEETEERYEVDIEDVMLFVNSSQRAQVDLSNVVMRTGHTPEPVVSGLKPVLAY